MIARDTNGRSATHRRSRGSRVPPRARRSAASRPAGVRRASRCRRLRPRAGPCRNSRCQMRSDSSSSRFQRPFHTSSASTSSKPNSHADPGNGTDGWAATTSPPPSRTWAAKRGNTPSLGPYRQSTQARGDRPTASQCPCRVVTSSPGITSRPPVRQAGHTRLAAFVLCSVETMKSSPLARAAAASSSGSRSPSEWTVCRCRSPRYHRAPLTDGDERRDHGFACRRPARPALQRHAHVPRHPPGTQHHRSERDGPRRQVRSGLAR